MEIFNESIEVWRVILIVLGCMLIEYFIIGWIFERMKIKANNKLLSWKFNKKFIDTIEVIERERCKNTISSDDVLNAALEQIKRGGFNPIETCGIRTYPAIDDSLNLIQWLEINCTLSSRNGWDYKGELITKEKLFSAYIKSINL